MMGLGYTSKSCPKCNEVLDRAFEQERNGIEPADMLLPKCGHVWDKIMTGYFNMEKVDGSTSSIQEDSKDKVSSEEIYC